jgi:hypothetical protein
VRHLVRARKAPDSDKGKKLFKELEEREYGRIEWREAANGRKVAWFIVDPM